ncbi:hypothetical protein QVD17_06856 [Tagetes erecta]|uniref:Reverse transcriptase zinc-binding domain-containing protein n=1 Tax=Tagetes erecta TaxID=13708 RepID=A0AAD8LEE2_TARER|nr:hypothetical protein QVD17_06856 [Tagetes erecta]
MSHKHDGKGIETTNRFNSLCLFENGSSSRPEDEGKDMEEESDVEEIYNETEMFMKHNVVPMKISEGASTTVLSSMHVYWSSVFILPSRIIEELEAKMRGFLWCQGPMKKGKAKVSWEAICVPRSEGGLGIRRIGDMNKALMTSHIWSIITNRESLWVAWVHAYRLRGKSFWDYCIPSRCCWSFKKMASLRSDIRDHVWHKVGNGQNTFAWLDKWCEEGPLCKFIAPRVIRSAGFTRESKLVDIIHNGNWRWPLEWVDRFQILNGITPMMLNNSCDEVLWKSGNGNELKPFSTTEVLGLLHSEEVEARCTKEFEEAAYDEELFMKQKAKVEWLRAGDSNSAYFHKGVFTRKLRPETADMMVREVTNEEIREAIFSIGNDRAPGPDGFTSAFFKSAWDGNIKPKVAWKVVCCPKAEGGLGIRRIADVNIALMSGHIWSIITHRKSVWVEWIYEYKLQNKCLWDVTPKQSMSWGWRKILQLREQMRPHLCVKVGDGGSTFIWSDNWCTESPLRGRITPRDIYIELVLILMTRWWT